MKSKKLLALAVALAMVFSVCVTGYAAEEVEDVTDEVLDEVVDVSDDAFGVDVDSDIGYIPEIGGVIETEEPEPNFDVQVPDDDVDVAAEYENFFDKARAKEFTASNVRNTIMYSGIADVLDSFNDYDGTLYEGADELPLMANFGYDEELGRFFRFAQLSDKCIMEKLDSMGIYDMDGLVDWIYAEPYAYLAMNMDIFTSYGNEDDAAGPTRVECNISANNISGSVKIPATYGWDYGDEISSGIDIEPEPGYKITNISVTGLLLLKRTDPSGEQLSTARRGGNAVYAQIMELNPDYNGTDKFSISAELLNRTQAETVKDDPDKQYCFLANGGEDQLLQVLFSVTTAPIEIGNIQVQEDGKADNVTRTYTFNGTPYKQLKSLNDALSLALHPEGGSASTYRAGSLLTISYDETDVEGVAVEGAYGPAPTGNLRAAGHGYITLKVPAADDESIGNNGTLDVSIVYKEVSNGLSLSDGVEEGSVTDDEFWNKYVTSVTVSDHIQPFTTLSELNEELKTRKVGAKCDLTFAFKDTGNKINKATVDGNAALTNGTTVSGIVLVGKEITQKDADTYIIGNGGGSWSDEGDFIPKWNNKTDAVKLTLDFISTNPTLAFVPFVCNDKGINEAGVGVAVEPKNSDGETVPTGSRLSVTATWNSAVGNPNPERYTGLFGAETWDITSQYPYAGVIINPKNGKEFNYGYTFTVHATLTTATGTVVEDNKQFTITKGLEEPKKQE